MAEYEHLTRELDLQGRDALVGRIVEEWKIEYGNTFKGGDEANLRLVR